MTVEYTFYVLDFRGKLSEPEFDRLSVRAAAYLDTLTTGRINRPDLPAQAVHKARLALCACIDELARIEEGTVTAESNDGVSVTYARSNATDDQRLYRAAAAYLTTTGLLYRGCCF